MSNERTVRLVRYHRDRAIPPPTHRRPLAVRHGVTVLTDCVSTGFTAGMCLSGMARYPLVVGVLGLPFLLLHLALWIRQRVVATSHSPRGAFLADLAAAGRRPLLPGLFGTVVGIATMIPIAWYAGYGAAWICGWPTGVLLGIVIASSPLWESPHDR